MARVLERQLQGGEIRATDVADGSSVTRRAGDEQSLDLAVTRLDAG
jgi:hypothetical protein